MTPSSPSSTHHGHIHITFPRSQNWTTPHLHLLPHRHLSLPVHPVPLSRALWNSIRSRGKLFPISSRTLLHQRKYTCLSHIVKRGRTARPPSEFFGPYPDHSVIPHQHHVANHKYHHTMLRNRRGVSYSHRSRASTLLKSTPRILLYCSFRHFFFSSLVRIY